MAQSVGDGSDGHGAAGDRPKLILVTGAGGAVGSVGGKLVAMLRASGFPVRAQVRRLDERSEALAKTGAGIVVADFTRMDDTMRAVQGCDRVFFCLSVSDAYLEAALNVIAAAKHHGVELFVNLSQMTVSQMSITNITNAKTSKQQRYHWLVEQVLAWSNLAVVEVRGTVFLEHPFFSTMAAKTIREAGELRLPFRDGKISPTAATDVTRVAFEVITSPRGHAGKVYHVVGPESLDGAALAAQYARALGRDVKYVDVPLQEWAQTDLAALHLSEHLRDHFMTLAAKTVRGENDRHSDDVELVTGAKALTVEAWVRQNIHMFTAP
jgi:NAD(P)H dehydrogenase (quinone)